MAHARLTHGDISRQLIALSVPLLMGNILQQLYNTVDAVIVGRFVGDIAFGAAARGRGPSCPSSTGRGRARPSAGSSVCPVSLERGRRWS